MSVQFPMVPNAPGVPGVQRTPDSTDTGAPMLSADAPSLSAQAPKWGVYNAAGAEVLSPSSYTAFEISHDWKIADFPIEQGGFASYDKVRVPPHVKLECVLSGSATARQSFLNRLFAIADDTSTLYSIQIPEDVITPYSVEHFDWARTHSRGVTMITASLHFIYINLVQAGGMQNTAQPAAADPYNGGTAQPQAPTAAQNTQMRGWQ